MPPSGASGQTVARQRISKIVHRDMQIVSGTLAISLFASLGSRNTVKVSLS